MALNENTKVAIVCIVLACAGVAVWLTVGREHSEAKVSYSQFLAQVRADQVAGVVIAANSGASVATGRLKDGNVVRTVLPPDYRHALAEMQNKLVNIEIQDPSSQWSRILINAAPFCLILGIWVFLMMRKFSGGRGQGISVF